ncbi:MAG TPA: 16S rRNA (cytosine(967)-C(5))-methyltransferase, partial [Gammaproteobacteria bacterium]|nr:16S rRNA (cytosine(967)-C(5))-methyltransferase [Gammaproteobacteria bacterium]
MVGVCGENTWGQRMQSRLAAARAVRAVRRGASLNRALPEVLTKTDADAHATIQALSYGVLRRYELIEALLALLLKKPLKRKDEIVTDLLRVALFELLDSAKPDYAVVDSVVDLVKRERRWASGLANGVLRRFLRERESLVQAALEQPSARYLLPDWLLGKLRKAWPDSFEDLAAALAEPAPMTLRVDLSRVERDVYLQRLGTEGIQATPHVSVPSAIVLQSPGDIRQLPGFEEGEVSVQDAAAQLAGWLLDLKPGLRALDACAAPGGKT